MIFAFDLDGTITAAPDLFSVLSHALRNAGHKVYIITARHEIMKKQTELYLSNRDIVHDGLFFEYDKLKKAQELGVDYAFDDMPELYNDGIKQGHSIIQFDEDNPETFKYLPKKVGLPFRAIKVKK